MKARLTFALAAVVLTLTITGPTPRAEQSVTAQQCATFCMKALCPEYCGLYTNSSGQRVCGCFS